MSQLPICSPVHATCKPGRTLSATVFIIIALLCPTVQAEFLGLLPGREATPVNVTDLSVELGFVTGRLEGSDYQNIAARVNYRLSPEMVLTATVGTGEFGLTDGVPLGVGLSYHLSNQRISEKVAIAGRVSYHFGDFALRQLEGEISSFMLEVLVSGAKPLMSNGLTWYSNVGYHLITVDFGRSDSTNEAGIGGGLVLPAGLGEAYVGAEFIDEAMLGIGVRYFVQ
ncbi:MAG: hypothetical protein AB8B64_19945 [Granulosicoccus sp.]